MLSCQQRSAAGRGGWELPSLKRRAPTHRVAQAVEKRRDPVPDRSGRLCACDRHGTSERLAHTPRARGGWPLRGQSPQPALGRADGSTEPSSDRSSEIPCCSQSSISSESEAVEGSMSVDIDRAASCFGSASLMMRRARSAAFSGSVCGSSAALTARPANRSAFRFANAFSVALGPVLRVIPSTRRSSALARLDSAEAATARGWNSRGFPAMPRPECAEQKSRSLMTAALQGWPSFLTAQQPPGPGASPREP